MKKFAKWLLIIGGGVVVLVIAMLIIAPFFVNVEKFKPIIEEKVSKATGRPFAIRGDLDLSLFPWAGLAFSDLHLGNPPGFKEKDFISIKSFDLKVKLLPLLSKDIQVERFVAEEPRIVMIKGKRGQSNWEGLGKPDAPGEKTKKEKKDVKAKGLPISSISVKEFAVKKASLLWIDKTKGQSNEISDLNLFIEDVSLDRPLQIAFSTKVDGNPFSMEGKIGPLGEDPGKGIIPLDLIIEALGELEIKLKGTISDPASTPRFDVALEISPFSPRQLFDALGKKFPDTSDPEALSRLALRAGVKGTQKKLSISKGKLQLDDSNMDFSVNAKEFNKPDLTFELNMDKIDADRYLPPGDKDKEEKVETKSPSGPQEKTVETDYAPLRRLVLQGAITIGDLKIKGAQLNDINLKISGKNGLFHIKPLTLNLYEGSMRAKGDLDVRKNTPESSLDIQAAKILIGPLLKDVLKKDIIEGTFRTAMRIRMKGDDAGTIKKTLNGKGNLFFKDGAIIGVDLDSMVRNIKSAFGEATKDDRPRTDFSEINSAFSITDGLIDTRETTLISPLLRLLAEGKANLIDESLDFRIQPRFVATIKGQGDSKKRSGITVPLKITGDFSSPKFRPDLEGAVKKGVEKALSDPSTMEKLLDDKTEKDEKKKVLEDTAKSFLKGLTSDGKE